MLFDSTDDWDGQVLQDRPTFGKRSEPEMKKSNKIRSPRMDVDEKIQPDNEVIEKPKTPTDLWKEAVKDVDSGNLEAAYAKILNSSKNSDMRDGFRN